jgi:hypothetical protein
MLQAKLDVKMLEDIVHGSGGQTGSVLPAEAC